MTKTNAITNNSKNTTDKLIWYIIFYKITFNDYYLKHLFCYNHKLYK